MYSLNGLINVLENVQPQWLRKCTRKCTASMAEKMYSLNGLENVQPQ